MATQILMPKSQNQYAAKFEHDGVNIDVLSSQTVFVEPPPYMRDKQPSLPVIVGFQDDVFNRTLKELIELMDTNAVLTIFLDQFDGLNQSTIATWRYDVARLKGFQPGPFNYFTGESCYLVAQFECEAIVPMIP